jgi:hypothetical protein
LRNKFPFEFFFFVKRSDYFKKKKIDSQKKMLPLPLVVRLRVGGEFWYGLLIDYIPAPCSPDKDGGPSSGEAFPIVRSLYHPTLAQARHSALQQRKQEHPVSLGAITEEIASSTAASEGKRGRRTGGGGGGVAGGSSHSGHPLFSSLRTLHRWIVSSSAAAPVGQSSSVAPVDQIEWFASPSTLQTLDGSDRARKNDRNQKQEDEEKDEEEQEEEEQEEEEEEEQEGEDQGRKRGEWLPWPVFVSFSFCSTAKGKRRAVPLLKGGGGGGNGDTEGEGTPPSTEEQRSATAREAEFLRDLRHYVANFPEFMSKWQCDKCGTLSVRCSHNSSRF